MKLEGCRIVITGAGSGIGAAVLKRLSRIPMQIIAVDVKAFQVQQEADTQATIHTVQCDVGQADQLDALFEKALTLMGGIDIFIANAGFAYYEKIQSADWDHIDRLYRVNVYSPIYCAEKMLELNQGRSFKVVMTASSMAHVGIPGYALYSSTKAALHRFAEAYRFELADPRSLMLVYPIATRSQFFSAAGSGIPVAFPTQTSDYVAGYIVKGLETDAKSVHPSFLFRVLMLIDGVIPFRRIPQALEGRKFQAWLKKQGRQ